MIEDYERLYKGVYNIPLDYGRLNAMNMDVIQVVLGGVQILKRQQRKIIDRDV